jgi:hypothetical protein
MYDGFQWNEIEDMSEPRDRPACSLVQLEDGGVSQSSEANTRKINFSWFSECL